MRQAQTDIRALRQQLAEAERSLQARAAAAARAAAGTDAVGVATVVLLPGWPLRCRSCCSLRSNVFNAEKQASCASAYHEPSSAHVDLLLVARLALQVSEKAAEEKKREQAGLQKERLLLEKRAKKKQSDADKKVRGCKLVGALCGRRVAANPRA